MQMIEVSKLKPHPRNKEFFDDITGDKWEDFKKSIIRRGIVEPVVVTADLTIVSGHQRWRAAKELHILEIPCNITYYPERDEKLNINKNDMILEDLISTNILQRGIGNCNAMKMAKCIVELERIYGIRQGSANPKGINKIGDLNNFTQQRTQYDLAKQIGITQRQLQRYKNLNNLIPELQSLVENDTLKSSTAYNIWAKLSLDKQHEFFDQIGIKNIKKLTQKQTQQCIIKKQRKSIPQTTMKHLINKTNGKCEICNWGGLGLEGILIPHHIHKYVDTKDNSINNLTLLCPNCHNTIHTLENCKDEKMIHIIKNNINKNIINKIDYYVDELKDTEVIIKEAL